MKHGIVTAMLMALLWQHAQGQETKTVTGYLVDKSCAPYIVKKGPAEAARKGAAHTRECALEPECSKNGYGVVVDGTFIKFDAHGDVKAKEYLMKTKREENILVDVSGVQEGETFTVASVKDARVQATKQQKKPAKK